MKNVIILGAHSFVGTAVESYLRAWPDQYFVRTVESRGESWKNQSFEGVDSVFHVAGIAHSDLHKLTEEQKRQYYEVNTDLAIAVANKAKAEGVRQFIYVSSSIVYGESSRIGRDKTITKDTPCSPTNVYGDSKFQAERGLEKLSDEQFHVVLLRCPLIYGNGVSGNFPVLRKMAEKLLFFPKIKNQRSMLYVKNLAEFVRLLIENNETGIFWPCNRESYSTSEIVEMLARCRGKKMILVPGLSWALKLLGLFTLKVNKAFGNLSYEEGLGDYRTDYRIYDLASSIREMESER